MLSRDCGVCWCACSTQGKGSPCIFGEDWLSKPIPYSRPLPKKILDDLQELYHLLKEVLSRGQEVQRQEMTKQEVERWKLCCFLFSQSLSTIVYVIRDSDKLCVAVSIESVLTILK